MAIGKKQAFEEAEVYVAYYAYKANKYDKLQSSVKVVEGKEELNDKEAGEWINHPTEMADLSKGAKIKISFTRDAKGNIKLQSYEVLEKGEKAYSGGGGSGGSKGGSSYDSSGAAWGGALTQAVVIVEHAITRGLLPDPAKAKKGGGFDVYMAHIKMVRRQLFADSTPPSLAEVAKSTSKATEEDEEDEGSDNTEE